MTHTAGSITVLIDSELEDLIPGFIQSRHNDIKALQFAVESGDFETVERLGHSMKGNGAGYGFEGISAIGAALEMAGKEKNGPKSLDQIANLDLYLSNVVVVFE